MYAATRRPGHHEHRAPAPTSTGCRHVTYDGFMYNGFPADQRDGVGRRDDVRRRDAAPDRHPRGAARHRRAQGRRPASTRSIPATRSPRDDLDAAAARAGVTVESGDVVLVRTGDMRHLKAGDRQRYALGDASSSPACRCTRSSGSTTHDVAAVFTDTYAFESFPPPSPDWSDTLAVHMLHIRDMGLIQGQNWDLEDAGRRLRGRRAVRLPAGRRAGADHRRHQRAGQPGRREVAAAPAARAAPLVNPVSGVSDPTCRISRRSGSRRDPLAGNRSHKENRDGLGGRE